MLADEHEALLAEWAQSPLHANADFILDGVIDPPRWRSAPRRVLFLLREAYGGAGDLRESVRNEGGPAGPTFKTASLWAFILHHATPTSLPPLEEPPFDELLSTEAFLASAVVNIKKSAGQPRSDEEDLLRYARADGDRIIRQIDLIAPDVIVSGNVWSAVEPLFPDAKRVHDLVLRWRDRWIVDFWHPANQFPKLLNYHAFASVVQNGGVLSDGAAS